MDEGGEVMQRGYGLTHDVTGKQERRDKALGRRGQFIGMKDLCRGIEGKENELPELDPQLEVGTQPKGTQPKVATSTTSREAGFRLLCRASEGVSQEPFSVSIVGAPRALPCLVYRSTP